MAQGRVSPYTRKGRVYYRIRISIAGEKREVYSHKGVAFASEAHAEAVLSQIRGKLAEATDPLAAVAEFLPKRSKPNLVTEVMLRYLRDQEERAELREISAHTLRNLRRWIPQPEVSEERKPFQRKGARRGPKRKPESAHFRHLAGISVHELKRPRIVRFRRELERAGLGVESVRSILYDLRSFLVWCKREELIDRVPEVEIPERVQKRPALLTPERQRRVLEAIPWERRGIFLLMALGVRPGAARAVQVRDVADGFVVVRRAVQGHNAHDRVGTTKARRENWVPMTRDLAAWVQEFGRERLPDARLFWNPAAHNKGQLWTHKAVHAAWERACKDAGVSYVSLYFGTKHSFATGRLMAGKPKDAVAEFMQISRQQVDTYAQWARELSAAVLDDEEISDETRATVVSLRGGEPVGNRSGGSDGGS